MLAARGARVNGTNMGDDTPLHIAASKGHREVVLMVSFVYDIMRKFLSRKAVKRIIVLLVYASNCVIF